MKLTHWYIAALAPVAIAGCSGTFFGHVAVLALTLGIFFGTLSLGRSAATASAASVPSVHPAAQSEAPSALNT